MVARVDVLVAMFHDLHRHSEKLSENEVVGSVIQIDFSYGQHGRKPVGFYVLS